MQIRNILLSTAAVFAPATLISSPAFAQSATLDPPPLGLPLDEHGVDLASGDIVPPGSTVAIGGATGLAFNGVRVGNGWRHNWMLSITVDNSGSNPVYSVQIGGAVAQFEKVSGSFNAMYGETGSLSETGTEFVYTGGDGSEVRFSKTLVANGESYYEAVEAVGTKFTAPNGAQVDLYYRGDSYSLPFAPGVTIYIIRLQSVTNNAGYQLKFDYTHNTPNPSTFANEWYEISRVTAINNAEEYCSPTADNCTLTDPWPYINYSWSGYVEGTELRKLHTFADILGRETRFRTDGTSRLIGIKRPGESDDGVEIAYDSNSRVSSVTHQGSYTRTYTWTESSGELTSVSDDSLGRERTVVTDIAMGQIKSVEDALGNTTTYAYDTDERLESVTAPEGNKVEYTYDSRGNVTEVRQKPKPGSSLADIVTTSAYPASCTNQVTCNLPTSTTDARGNTTNFTYDSVHGGVTKIELPQDSNGVRPTTEYSYSAYTAKRKNSSGTLVNEATSITLADEVTRCRTAATCSGTANERVFEVTFDSFSSPNLNPVSTTAKAGNNTLTATANLTYTSLGNVETVDGPLAGTGDTTTYRYDDAGQLIGTIAADPDGAGSLKHIATRLTYNDDGQITLTERGHVAGTSDTDWAGFTTRAKFATSYDDFGRVETSSQPHRTGTTQHSIMQYSYDNAGRLECTALRMNAPLTTTTLPASACTAMSAGPFGEDQISKRHYDAADRLTEVWAGVDTSLAQQDREMNYNANGTLNWIDDAANNRTRYYYDGFDRNRMTYYPDPNNPGSTNSGDREERTFDANSNVLTFRTREAKTFNFTYDKLNRLTLKDVPTRTGLNSTHTRDVHYGYDLFGALTYARFNNAVTGVGVAYSYDALGRVLSESQNSDGNMRIVSSQYDVAGRRTRITHPDGAYWTYTYDKLNRLTAVKDDGGSTLVSNLYRDWGELYRRNRDASAPDDLYYNDDAERLNRIFLDHPNSAHDVNRRYTLNPAGHVIDEEVDNQSYVWNAHPSSNQDIDYTADGLNRYSDVEGTTFTYDTNQNLTSDGSTTFTYDLENRLVSASGANSVTLHYDPLGRLYQVDGGAQRWLYDGNAMIGSFNTPGTQLDRYVHGASAGDDPLIHYDGNATERGDAEHLYTDRVGSVVATFKNNGTLVAKNSYDEFGVPGSTGSTTNKGRFRFTGQIWLPELGQYHYKARAYSPGLGRFVQTDPIGYGDGMNRYAYVRNNPQNLVDPLGLNSLIPCLEKDRVECTPTPHHVRDSFNRVIVDSWTSFIDTISYPFYTLASWESDASCQAAIGEGGVLRIGSLGGSLVIGGGGTYARGKFYNNTTGTSGTFESRGASVGFDASLSGVGGFAPSAAHLVGGSVTLSGGVFGGSGSVAIGVTNGELGASSVEAGVSAGTRDGLSGSATFTQTRLINCSYASSGE